ncbi:MAG: hypothetical protein GXO94_05075 [Nitrospirae bacterium]|nr:hypothetical protein [Nitrospirota bacterium]
MAFWDKLKKDIKKGIDEGLHVFKEGTTVIKKRAETLSDDVKSKVKIFELKQKIQVHLTDLGGRVYEIASDKRRNPLTNEKVKSIVEKIKKIEAQIEKLEAKAAKKAAASTTARKGARKAARKTTAKKTPRKSAEPSKSASGGRRTKKA